MIKLRLAKNQTKQISYYFLLCLLYLLLSFISVYHFTKNGELAIKELVDAPFHLERVRGLATIWQGPISFNNFFHYGNPVNLFYPWLTMYPLFLLYQITGHLISSYYLFFIALTFITAWLCYYVAIKMTNSRLIAIIFSFIYVLAPYRQTNILFRHAVGEAIAMTFLPLLIYGLYKIMQAQQKSAWVLLAVSLAAIAYTHILSLVMCSIFIVVFVVIACLQKQIKKTHLWQYSQSVIWSILLAVGALGPIVSYHFIQTINPPQKQKLVEQALKPFELLAATINNQLGTRQYTIGLMIFISLIFIFVSWRKLTKFEQTLVYAGLVFLVASTTLLPWFYLQSTLGMLQFPWRFMSIATICLAYVGSVAFVKVLLARQWSATKIIIVPLCIGLVLQGAVISNFQPRNAEYKTHLFTDQNIKQAVRTKFNGEADYMNIKAYPYLKFYKQQQIISGTKKLKTTANYQAKAVTYTVVSPKKAYGSLPVLYNPGIKIYNNGHQIKGQQNQRGGYNILLQKGKNQIQVKSTYPTFMKIEYLVSIIALIGLIIYVWWQRPKKAS